PLGSEVLLVPSKLTATLSPGISVKHLVQYTYLQEEEEVKRTREREREREKEGRIKRGLKEEEGREVSI
uniref:Uncharacterized protein n=1 Tax=Amphimedon queenslandica TaxID=400682 RepID=A0A1X7VLE4_AMPQE